jgi:hypothetical protein
VSVDRAFRNKVPGPGTMLAWTPTVTASAGTFTTVSGAGRWGRTGVTVNWSLTVTITTVGTASGEVRFTLPSTAFATAGYIGSGREDTSTGAQLQARLVSATQAAILRYDNASAIGAGRTLLLSGTYEVT